MKEQPIELMAGTHIELHRAKITGGVRVRNGKVQIGGLEAAFADFHGAMADIEKLGSSGFEATVILEGRVIREAVPDGQQQLPGIGDQAGPPQIPSA